MSLLPDLPESFQMPWPHQVEPVQRIVKAFNDGHKVVVLDAPPGAGKTLIAEYVRRALTVKSLFLCHTKTLQQQVCVAPSTRILTADLRWVPAGDLCDGDELLAFDEKPSPKRRNWRKSVVLNSFRRKEPCYRITFESGLRVVCSEDHQWLVGRGQLAKWISTKDLRQQENKSWGRSGDVNRFASKVIRLLDPWEEGSDWETGYLAGIFDGEGHLHQSQGKRLLPGGETRNNGAVVTLSFAQADNAALGEALRILDKLGYRYNLRWRPATEKWKPCATVEISGRHSVIRILGHVRPRRLLGKFRPDNLGMIGPVRSDAVVRKEFVGLQDVVVLGTSTGTYVAEGLASHNCRDFPYSRLIMGRENYPTYDVESGKTADACDIWRGWPCQADKCEERREMASLSRWDHCSWCHPTAGAPLDACPYMRAKVAATVAPVAVANLAYALGEWQSKTSVFKGWPMVVVDEWDMAEDALLNSRELRVTSRMAARFKVPYPSNLAGMTPQWIADAALKVAKEYERVDLLPPEERPADWPKLRELGEKFAMAAYGMMEGSWIPLTHDERMGCTLGPIMLSAELSNAMLWEHGERFLLMSGTAIDPTFRLRQLGWFQPTPIIRVRSTYPAQNRPVHVWPVASMLKKHRETSTPMIAKAVEEILAHHPDDRVLVHSGTYQIADELVKLLAAYADRLVTFQSSSARDDAISRYLTRPKSVLIGPAMERGLDLAGEACRVVVFTRCPYKYMGDPRVQARSHMKGFWIEQAVDLIATLVQSTQRGVRSATDRCEIFILDAQFKKLRTHGLYAPRWPLWWSLALQEFDGYKDQDPIREPVLQS